MSASDRWRSAVRRRLSVVALLLLVASAVVAHAAEFPWPKSVSGNQGAVPDPWIRTTQGVPDPNLNHVTNPAHGWSVELLSGQNGPRVATLTFGLDPAISTLEIGTILLEGGDSGPWKGHGAQAPLYEVMTGMAPVGTNVETHWAWSNLREYNKARFGFSLSEMAGLPVQQEMVMENHGLPTIADPLEAGEATPSYRTMSKCGMCLVAVDPADVFYSELPHAIYTRRVPSPPPSRWARAWSAVRRAGSMNMGPASAVFGAVAVGMVGYLVGGEHTAMGAGFVYGTAIGKTMSGGTMSWRMAGVQSGVGLAAGYFVDRALAARGYNGVFRTAANIGVGSAVGGVFAGLTRTGGMTWGAAAGSGALSTGLYGLLAAEGMYHASQYVELFRANQLARAGDPDMKRAMNEISFGGSWNSWSPLTWYAYGAKTYASGDFSALGLVNPF